MENGQQEEIVPDFEIGFYDASMSSEPETEQEAPPTSIQEQMIDQIMDQHAAILSTIEAWFKEAEIRKNVNSIEQSIGMASINRYLDAHIPILRDAIVYWATKVHQLPQQLSNRKEELYSQLVRSYRALLDQVKLSYHYYLNLTSILEREKERKRYINWSDFAMVVEMAQETHRNREALNKFADDNSVKI